MPTLSTLQSLLGGIGVHVDAAQWLAFLALILARVVTAAGLTPFFGGNSVPNSVRVAFGVLISLVLMPTLAAKSDSLPSSFMVFTALLLKEVLIGAVIGFLAQLVFYAVQMAGVVVDTQSGLNQIAFLAPQLPGHTSALGNLQFQASLVLFFAMQGHLLFIGALAQSFKQLPLLVIPQMSSGLFPMAEQVTKLTGNALLIALQLAAPVVLAIFLTDITFGVVGRVASQVRIGNESYTAKAMVAIGLVFLLVPAFAAQIRDAFASMLNGLEGTLNGLR